MDHEREERPDAIITHDGSDAGRLIAERVANAVQPTTSRKILVMTEDAATAMAAALLVNERETTIDVEPSPSLERHEIVFNPPRDRDSAEPAWMKLRDKPNGRRGR